MFSIDQNCHSLWDVLPKLHALASRGYKVTHFVEDIDVAFTSLGSGPGGGQLRLERERFHRSGGADWGAALFYSEFLGRLPVEIRDWEPLTGMKTNALAKQLGRTVDELFDEFSPSDNWQLIGPSYIGDHRHHRVIGDLTVAETAEFLRRILEKAREDMLKAFPQRDSQQRLQRWFSRETELLEGLLTEHAEGRLVELYRAWLRSYLDETVHLNLTSNLFAVGERPEHTALLEAFLADYELAAGLYNEAVEATDVRLRPLRTKDGELPFFAVLEHQGHRVRTGVFLRDGGMAIGDRTFKGNRGGRIPAADLRAAGVRCLAGKAILLVIAARLGPNGEALALPYRGSLYMPAAHRLAENLSKHGLLPGKLRPIMRVRFHLLDRLASLSTRIRLPAHLAPSFGTDELPASEFAANYRELAKAAAGRLDKMADPDARRRWRQASFPKLLESIDELDRRRRDLVAAGSAPEQVRRLWEESKALQRQLLDRTLRQIAADYQLRDLDYWDSRGALLPWSVALGGKGFYDELISQAEIYEDPPQSPRDG